MTLHISEGTMQAIVRTQLRKGYAQAIMDSGPKIDDPDILARAWARARSQAMKAYPARSVGSTSAVATSDPVPSTTDAPVHAA